LHTCHLSKMSHVLMTLAWHAS